MRRKTEMGDGLTEKDTREAESGDGVGVRWAGEVITKDKVCERPGCARDLANARDLCCGYVG